MSSKASPTPPGRWWSAASSRNATTSSRPPYIQGSGKVTELAEIAQATDADAVIFDNDLSPAQVRNLEQATSVKVIDRSELILDIFATRARSTEAKLQGRAIAQLEYFAPAPPPDVDAPFATLQGRHRPPRSPARRSSKRDRRLVGLKIRDLKDRLAMPCRPARQKREVSSRREEHTVSLVGYTRCRQEHADERPHRARDVLAEDKLFSTLDTRTAAMAARRLGQGSSSATPSASSRELPHHLVASFKATLEETRQAKPAAARRRRQQRPCGGANSGRSSRSSAKSAAATKPTAPRPQQD